jgi:predicted Zn finger-like uncharacterized protein
MRVIVTCERCDTRFHLDDGKVSATGARVRCSRCKHAFLVLPPETVVDDAVHALALDAAQRGAATPPGVTHDLQRRGSSPQETSFEIGAPATDDEEAEWRFAEDEPAEAARGQDPPGHRVPREDARESWDGLIEEEKPPEERDLDGLGSPESWSFVSEEAPPVRPERAGAAAGGPPEGAQVLGRVALRRRGSLEPVVKPKAKPVPKPRETAPAPQPSRSFERIGWAVTTVLLVAIVHGIAWGGGAPATAARTMPLDSGLVAEELTLVRVDSALAGPVLVVEGVVRNPGASPVAGSAILKVRVVGAQRVAEADATPPRSREALRSADPRSAAAVAPALELGRIAPGAALPFQAVIEGPPRGKISLDLEIEEASPDARPGAGEAATGDPSRPAPLPSSG